MGALWTAVNKAFSLQGGLTLAQKEEGTWRHARSQSSSPGREPQGSSQQPRAMAHPRAQACLSHRHSPGLQCMVTPSPLGALSACRE